jgi:hypothetical protein
MTHMEIPIVLDPADVPRKRYSRGAHRDRIRVFVDAQTRSRLTRLVTGYRRACGFCPSLSTIVRAGLMELETRLIRQADDPETLCRKINEAARGGC